MAAEPVHTTVPMQGAGWAVSPRPAVGLVALRLDIDGQRVFKGWAPGDARLLAAAIAATADELEQRG